MKKKFLAFIMMEPSRTNKENPSSELPLVETHEFETDKSLTSKKEYDDFIKEITGVLAKKDKVKYKRCVVTGLTPMV